MSNSSEKFCLKWNNFPNNVAIHFRELRKYNYYSDVTLVSEDNQQIEAHKVILTACSPFFSSLLKMTNHSHPLIYMRGLKAKELAAIMDFIYHGEANIFQDDLEGFLALADELQLEGLATSENTQFDEIPEQHSKVQDRKGTTKVMLKEEYTNIEPVEIEDTNLLVPINDGVEAHLALDPSIKDMKAKIDSLLERDITGEYKCTVCGKKNTGNNDGRKNMKQHIETHFEGIYHPCKQCEKVTRTLNGLRMHVLKHHPK